MTTRVEPEASPAAPSKNYSKAFENFVEASDDVVGLLAYALFKAAIREEVRQGTVAGKAGRNPMPSTVNAFRLAAEQQITEVVNQGISGATPDIEKHAVAEALGSVKSEILTHVTSRTGFLGSFLTNLLAWATTLAIAVLILFLADRPSVEKAAVGVLEKTQAEVVENLQAEPK